MFVDDELARRVVRKASPRPPLALHHDLATSGLQSRIRALLAADAQTRQVIGSSRYHGYQEEPSEIEIGWTFLARSHWGGRYNGEMKRLMLEHAFKFVTTVVFLIDPQNIRSQKAVEKIGAIRSGLRSNADGRDSFVFRITESFKAPRSAAFHSPP